MSVRRPSGRPSNMGQESSTLAQQSINISAGVPRATSTHGMQSQNAVSDSTNNHHAYSTPRGRSRSPGNGPPSRYPLPQKQRVQSLGTHMRSRSPPPHSTGRFPSPGNVRNKFVREDVGERRHTYDARYRSQQSSPQSPDARLGIRNDGVHQRSPEWRSHSENYQNWVRNAGSPNTPREPLAQRSHVSATERGRNVAAGTIDYHGLRDVPTGPRPKKMDSIARSPPKPEKRDFITRSPCIFISFQHLPNSHKLTRHLRGMLGRCMPGVIETDDYGWNLIYEDSSAGLEKLTRCFEKYNNELMFSEYELCMQCYPNGKQHRTQRDIDTYSSGEPDDTGDPQVPHERPDNSVVPRLAGFPGRQLTYPESTKSLESTVDALQPNAEKADALARTPSHALPENLFSHSSNMTRTNEVPPMGTNSSLLSLRSDRDETGSLGSGVTRSDGSSVKRNKCYRCRGEAVPGSSILVRCTTCPRQYHRRCHQDFPIPADLTETSVWNCASCVKKEQASKEVPKEENQKSSSKSGKAILESRSLAREASDKRQSEMPDDRRPVAMNADEAMNVDETMSAEYASNEQLQLLRSDSKSPQHETQPQDDLTTSAKSGTVDEHAPLSDADDLVAKSFAAAEVPSHSKARTQKSGKLKITRTKLPAKPPITATQQQQSESQLDQNGSLVTDPPAATSPDTGIKAANMNEVVARNSVADLRALAHERHQTAIKNGAEGHFASEEQRLCHDAPENTPMRSPACQSPSETGSPQKPSTMLPGPSAPAAAKHATEREIPESPDEVRRGDASSNGPIINPRVQALLQRTENAFVPPPRRTSNVTSAQDEKSPALMRPRPRAPLAVVQCHNCQKPIPGKNKLCSGCKRDAAAAAGSNVLADVKPAPQTFITPLRNSFAPVANMGHSPQTIAAPAELGPQGEEVSETTDREQDPSVEDGGKGRVACDTCRKYHKRCTHNGLVAQVPTAIATNEQGDGAARPDKPTQGTTASNAEDASPAQQAKTSAPDQDLVRNPLAAGILGGLQYAPTVQMLLRENQYLEADKIRQLKKILEENVTARTDMPLLERLIFIHDTVGDSGDRPKGSRLILVAMALGSSASRRLQAKDVMDWIVDTVPMYKKGEGNWGSRISAMLSQGRLLSSGSGYGGYTGYWREDEWQEGDGGKPKAKWYQLLPEKEDEMWTWCPVLKKPLPPSETRKTGKSAAQRATAAAPASTVVSTSGPVTPMSNTNGAVSTYGGSFVQDGKRLSAASAEEVGDDDMDIDGIVEDPPQSFSGLKRKHHSRLNVNSLFTPETKDASSSDDEPLSAIQKRRRVGTLSRADTPTVQQSTPRNKDTEGHMDLEPGANTTSSAKTGDRVESRPDSVSKASCTSGARRRSRVVTPYLNGSRRPSNAETSDRYLTAKREQLATSLYNEWPEFRQHASDEHDKLAEIQNRPRKKQLFGKLASHPQVRFAQDSYAQTGVLFNFSPEKRSRTRMADPRPDEPYPWENPDNDPTRKEYKSLEELFDFPDNMIPIVSEGQLAYRDGTRTDDGRLPRAREIFKL